MATSTTLTAVRLPDQERRILESLARIHGATYTDTVRMALRAMSLLGARKSGYPKDVLDMWREQGLSGGD